MARAHTQNLGFTWPGLTNTQFGAHMAGAHKHTIWGSHGLGPQTYNLGLTWLGLTHNLELTWPGLTHNLGLTWPGLTHTIWGSLGRASHTHTIWGLHIAVTV